MNLSPLFNNDISASVCFLLDKFIILMSLSIFFYTCWGLLPRPRPWPRIRPGFWPRLWPLPRLWPWPRPRPRPKKFTCVLLPVSVSKSIYMGAVLVAPCISGISLGDDCLPTV